MSDRIARRLFTCPHCGDVLSSLPELYTCPANPVSLFPVPPRPDNRRRLSDADVIRLRTGDLADLEARLAAKRLGITVSYVYLIRAGKARKAAK